MDILISEDLDAPAIQELSKKFTVVRDATLWKDGAALKEKISTAGAIMVRNQTHLGADVLVALRARAFGMSVRAFDPFVPANAPALAEAGCELCEHLEEALGAGDFVSA